MAKVKVRPFKGRSKTFASRAEAEAWASKTADQLRRMRTDPQAVLTPQALLQHGASVTDAVANLPRLNLDESAAGIYFLFLRNKCIYVGQSRRVHMRVHEHRHAKRHRKEFDSYSWVTCAVEDLDRLERFYIEALRPVLNITYTDRDLKRAVYTPTSPERMPPS